MNRYMETLFTRTPTSIHRAPDIIKNYIGEAPKTMGMPEAPWQTSAPGRLADRKKICGRRPWRQHDTRRAHGGTPIDHLRTMKYKPK